MDSRRITSSQQDTTSRSSRTPSNRSSRLDMIRQLSDHSDRRHNTGDERVSRSGYSRDYNTINARQNYSSSSLYSHMVGQSSTGDTTWPTGDIEGQRVSRSEDDRGYTTYGSSSGYDEAQNAIDPVQPSSSDLRSSIRPTAESNLHKIYDGIKSQLKEMKFSLYSSRDRLEYWQKDMSQYEAAFNKSKQVLENYEQLRSDPQRYQSAMEELITPADKVYVQAKELFGTFKSMKTTLERVRNELTLYNAEMTPEGQSALYSEQLSIHEMAQLV